MRMSFFLLAVVFAVLPFHSVQGVEPYKLPPPEVVKIVDAPRTPVGSVSPTRESMLLVEYEPMSSISYMARPFLKLAGLRILPSSNSGRRSLFYTGISIMELEGSQTIRVSVPQGSKLGFPEWLHDGRWIAYPRYTEEGVELWVADGESGGAKPVTQPILNTTIGGGFQWMPDCQGLLVRLVPGERNPPPEPPDFPPGPNVQETAGKFSRVRTYQDLLKDSHDEVLFSYYAGSQMRLWMSVLAGRPGWGQSVSTLSFRRLLTEDFSWSTGSRSPTHTPCRTTTSPFP